MADKKKILIDANVHRRVKASAAMEDESITDHAAQLLAEALDARAKLASLESGGITTKDGIAMVHPNEAIVPLDELDDYLGENDEDDEDE